MLCCRLLRTAVYGTRVRLYDTRCAIEDVLKPDFTEVYENIDFILTLF